MIVHDEWIYDEFILEISFVAYETSIKRRV